MARCTAPREGHRTKKLIFTRKQLLDLVWSAPMRSVAAEIGLSDVGLKKAVVKAGIPTPPQGHWNRVAAGKKAPQKALSDEKRLAGGEAGG